MDARARHYTLQLVRRNNNLHLQINSGSVIVCTLTAYPFSPPLSVFKGFGRRDIVKLLIEKGSQVDSRDEGTNNDNNS